MARGIASLGRLLRHHLGEIRFPWKGTGIHGGRNTRMGANRRVRRTHLRTLFADAPGAGQAEHPVNPVLFPFNPSGR